MIAIVQFMLIVTVRSIINKKISTVVSWVVALKKPFQAMQRNVFHGVACTPTSDVHSIYQYASGWQGGLPFAQQQVCHVP